MICYLSQISIILLAAGIPAIYAVNWAIENVKYKPIEINTHRIIPIAIAATMLIVLKTGTIFVNKEKTIAKCRTSKQTISCNLGKFSHRG